MDSEIYFGGFFSQFCKMHGIDEDGQYAAEIKPLIFDAFAAGAAYALNMESDNHG